MRNIVTCILKCVFEGIRRDLGMHCPPTKKRTEKMDQKWTKRQNERPTEIYLRPFRKQVTIFIYESTLVFNRN